VAVLDQLDEDTECGLRVHERDGVAAATWSRGLVDEPDALAAQVVQGVLHGVDSEADVMQPRAVLREVLRDGGIVAGGLQQLDEDAADIEHGFLDAIGFDALAILGRQAEGPLVEGQRLVEVLHGDGDLVDPGHGHGVAFRVGAQACLPDPSAAKRAASPVRHAIWFPPVVEGVVGSALKSQPARPRPQTMELIVTETVVLGYARTPLGRFSGGFSSLSAMDLGGAAIAGALERSGVPADQVGYVVMGHVLQAGLGQITARQAAVKGGLALDIASETMNKVCLSGMTAIGRADGLIRLGDFDVVVAGGMESMTNAPYVLDKARSGYRLGNGELVDSLMFDGLTCAFDGCAMGLATDQYQESKGLNLSREAQDEFAARSHERAAAAQKDGAFDTEIVPVAVPQRKGDPLVIDADEGVRPGTSVESLAALRPAFRQEGTITAGNASQISDGGAALILASRDKADSLGITPIATIKSWGTVAGPDPALHLQPANAIRAAAAKIGADPSGFDLYEMNEAFASVSLASAHDLGLGDDRVNVNGGAISLGHPLGCSGARIVVTLINELRRRGGGTGAAGLCGGGGQGDAVIVEVA